MKQGQQINRFLGANYQKRCPLQITRTDLIITSLTELTN